jgi:hypothetical protein
MIQRASNNRRGLASLELALSMPFLVALAAAIWHLASFHQRQTQVTIEARFGAWEKRDDPGQTETDPPADKGNPAMLFRSGGGTLPQGLHVEQSKKKTLGAPPVFRIPPIALQKQHTVLGRSWDFHDIDYPTTSRLIPSDRMRSWLVAAGSDPTGPLSALSSPGDVLKLLTGQNGGLDVNKLLDLLGGLGGISSALGGLGSPGGLGGDAASGLNSSSVGGAAGQGGSALSQLGDAAKAAKDLKDIIDDPLKALKAPLELIKHAGDIVKAIGKLGDAVSAVGQLIDKLGDDPESGYR